jgi:putative peptidoglycan lipid II flippase
MGLWPAKADNSPNRKIFQAALIISFLTLVAKGGATIKELLVARAFGRSDPLDAFLIAYLLPSFVLGLVTGSLSSALLPALVAARQKQGAEAAQRLFSSMMFLTMLALGLVALLLGLLAPYYLPFLGSNFSPAKLALTRRLLYALLPVVLFNGAAALATCALNAREKFALPALAPLLTPLATILFIVLAGGRLGPFALAGGLVAGSILEAALLLQAMRVADMRFAVTWSGLTPDVRGVLGQYVPVVMAAFLIGGTSLVDQSMAAMLQPGSVAALSYGNRIIGVALSIGAAALSTAAFPYFSKMAAQNDWSACRHTLRRYTLLAALSSLPFTLLLMVFSPLLVRVLFQRGAFTAADTNLVSWVQICYAAQVPFYVCNLLFARFLSSARRNDVLMYVAGASLVADIILNLVLMRVLGIAGIALATSLTFALSCVALSACSARLLASKRTAVSGVPEQMAAR